jgi:hypothetical protein
MERLDWIETQIQNLDSKTKGYTEKEKTKIGYSYIKSALYIVPEKITDDTNLQEFKAKIEYLIDSLPIKKDGSKVEYGTYSSALSSFKNEIKKKYNIVSKGTYINQGVLGMPVGLLLGLMFDNIVFGLLIGLTIGLIIGSVLENKAKKENRLLD